MKTSLLQRTPIAIIGQAALFAQSANLEEFWDHIFHKVDCLTEVPPSRWNIEDYYDPDPDVPDKTYCKRGGFIPDIDFDPLEFGLPPALLEVTDVSQLLGLVVARDALKDAGYGVDTEFNRAETGVVLGVAGGQKLITDLSARLQYPIWRRVLENSGVSPEDTAVIIEKINLAYAPWNENSFPGLLGNVIAGRIANRFNLGGMNSVVDAACASSLAALKTAVSELVEGRAEMMISGGVDTDNSPFTFLCFSKTPAFSPSQEIRPFDAHSDGMLIGEGLGMVILKRLEDAQRDGDRIYAVIRGIGSSSDGRYKSIYAPRPSGQSLAIDRAYQDAGFAPETISLLEAHGTGTKAGDPAEFSGLREIFGTPNGKSQTIALGSVKSQIGHTKAAAGAAGLIKTALALHQKVLPPTLHVETPSPALKIEESHFYLNTETRPWFINNGHPTRRGGVSAFGFGGTNFHVVLEEHDPNPAGAFRLNSVSQPIILWADSLPALISISQKFLEDLEGKEPKRTFHTLAEQSKAPEIPSEAPRLGFVADSPQEAQGFLRTALNLLDSQPESHKWDHPRGITFRAQGLRQDEKIVALFPGQGAQYLNMGRETTINFPPLRQAFEAMNALFTTNDQPALTDIVYPLPAFDEQVLENHKNALRETDYAQAAIGVFSFGLYKILQDAGFQPHFTAGHSFGELTALWAGGRMDDETFLRLVKARGQAMKPPESSPHESGTMAAVKGPLEAVQKEIEEYPEVSIANENAPTQVVLAGTHQAIADVEAHLSGQGYKVTLLPVSAAFHTPLVEHASAPFAETVAGESFLSSKTPVFSNTTGEEYPSSEQALQEILANHILHPVIFKTQIERIYQAGGRVFVEIGPRQILSNLVKEILEERPHTAVPLNPSREKSSDRQLREAVVKLQVLGLPLRDFDPYSAR